ncbi:Zinc transporter ZIP12 [Dirofilaria immitis]|nr:Zinc transporter ZIP12 [Dirofilaria immitis]
MNAENIINSLYGLIAITIISLLSLTGLVFLPVIKGKWRHRWMQIFIALAASTMSSDALLHILPQVVGVHDHSHHNHGHHHHDHNDSEIEGNHSNYHHYHDDHKKLEDETLTSDDHSMLLKMTAVIGAVYVLYMLEFISALPVWRKRKEATKIIPQNGWSDCESGSKKSIDNDSNHHHHHHHHQHHQHHGTISGIANEPVIMCGIRSAAFMIIFGDTIHNFIDGIAIGASFAISNQVGIATSIAVVCHELPHELGDFAVLIESGLSISRAIFLNFISSLTAYAGLFLGLAAISVDSAVEILLAITAGMFLYVAWLDMLIHLKNESASTNDKWYMTLLLQNIGFISGFLIMFTIGWYEETLASF